MGGNGEKQVGYAKYTLHVNEVRRLGLKGSPHPIHQIESVRQRGNFKSNTPRIHSNTPPVPPKSTTGNLHAQTSRIVVWCNKYYKFYLFFFFYPTQVLPFKSYPLLALTARYPGSVAVLTRNSQVYREGGYSEIIFEHHTREPDVDEKPENGNGRN